MAFDVKDLLIVLPAFNEQASIVQTLNDIDRNVPGANKLVVDDGSTDKTADFARQAGAQVAQLPFNLGVGGAMRFGFRHASRNGYKVVIQLDADGQHDPAYIPELLRNLDESDLVIGARFAGEGDYEVHGPRKWAMGLLSTVISRSANSKLTDTTSGFRASGPRAIELFAKDYPAEYLGDTVESLVIALKSGLTVSQVPVAMRKRTGGQPSQNAWRSAVFLFRAATALIIAYMRPADSASGPHGEKS